MAIHVCMGATLMCSFGVAPSSLVVLPTKTTMTSNSQGGFATAIRPLGLIGYGGLLCETALQLAD